ncbi:MAG TPA: hypothetical protein DEG76_09935 [Pseudohongiella sp.]|nr:hypothetical protein [Pseudohongiella sp.]
MRLFLRALTGLLMTAVSGLLAMPATAYEFDPLGNKWPGARTTIYTGIPGVSASGVPWAQAYREAAESWTSQTDFTFEIVPEFLDPCIGQTGSGRPPDFRNGAAFGSTICGRQFNSQTIAVTVFFTEFNTLGSADLVEADIVFNSNVPFDTYDGNQRIDRVVDFRRVALHELGHVMGLAHENTVPAIMNASIGNLFTLQQDDIDGVNVLYSGISNCENRPITFGWVYGDLNSGDCLIQDLQQGGSDDSFVDVYTLQVDQPMRVTLDTITSGGLDSVLLLADMKLDVLEIDENSAGACRPRVSANLPAGEYAILVNTYSNNTRPPCGETNTGNYRMSVTYESPSMLTLKGRQSFQGGEVNALFRGGVTRNNGQTYINRVSSTERFDVVGEITVDPMHRGQSGFVVVAGITPEGEILVKHPNGDFVGYRPDLELVPIFERRTLQAVESIDILKQFVARDIGVNTIDIDFLIGYGVDSNPNELYFHLQPINLLVE